MTVSVTENRNFISGTPDETVTINPNETTATLTVATDNDNIDELNGQIRAQLQSGTDYTTRSPSSATVTVEDNDMPELFNRRGPDRCRERGQHGIHGDTGWTECADSNGGL